MTISQLEYFVAVYSYRHFAKAAQACFVTQPTLSMQLKKLEEELGIHLFDRSKQPVIPTQQAELIIESAKEIIRLSKSINDKVKEVEGQLTGTFKLGIIPTVGPYLLPIFLNEFCKKHTNLKIEIQEHHTATLIELINSDNLDAAIVSTPLNIEGLKEIELYYEPFVVYFSNSEKLKKQNTVSVESLDKDRMWLLSEGHCFRNQVLNLCSPQGSKIQDQQIQIQVGSIEMLRSMVEINHGVTLLPELSIQQFNSKQRAKVRYFTTPEPVREISLVTRRPQLFHKVIQALVDQIKKSIPSRYKNPNSSKVIPL